MIALGTILFFIGMGIVAIGGLWFLIRAFMESILWGLLCLFTGVGNLIFLIVHWRSAKRPFLFQLMGAALALGGILLAGREIWPFEP